MRRRLSDRQLRAIFAQASEGNRPVGAKALGATWGRRGNNGKLVASSASARDRGEAILRQSRPLEARGTLLLKEADGDAARRQEARRALLRAAGYGTGLLVAGGALALARSPRLQAAVGRRLMQVRHPMPLRTITRILDRADDAYKSSRDAGIQRLGERAARGVRSLELKITGYTPGATGPLPYGPPQYRFWRSKRPLGVQEIGTKQATSGARQVQDWMADQAAHEPVHSEELTYGYQRGWVDKADIAIKGALAKPLVSKLLGTGRKVRDPLTGKSKWLVDFDPEFTVNHGIPPKKATLAETLVPQRWGRPPGDAPRPQHHTKARFKDTGYQRR